MYDYFFFYSLVGTMVVMVLAIGYIKSNPSSRFKCPRLKRKVAKIPLWDEEKRVCYKEVSRIHRFDNWSPIEIILYKKAPMTSEHKMFLPVGQKAILLEQNEGSLRKRSYDKPIRQESQRRASEWLYNYKTTFAWEFFYITNSEKLKLIFGIFLEDHKSFHYWCQRQIFFRCQFCSFTLR